MGSTTRKTRNYKEKSSMFAFGHIALPLVAVIAVGLLFIGIKLFFLSPSDEGVVEITPEPQVVVSQPAPAEPVETTTQSTTDAPSAETPPQDAPQPTVVLASPITQSPSTESSSTNDAPTPPATPSAPSRPSAPTNEVANTAPQPSSRPSSQPRALTSKYGVQIGAFTRQEGANAVVEEITKQGYVAAISSSEASGKVYHRVRVAAGDTREEAERLAAELQQKGYPVLVVANP